MKELKEVGLVTTVRQGLTKPNLIYVMNFATEYKYQTNKKSFGMTFHSSSVNVTLVMPAIAQASNTEITV